MESSHCAKEKEKKKEKRALTRTANSQLGGAK